MERFPPVATLESGWPESNKEEVSLDDLPSVPTHAPQAALRMPMPMPMPTPSPPTPPDHQIQPRKASAPSTVTATTTMPILPHSSIPLAPINGNNSNLPMSSASSTTSSNHSNSEFESSAIKQLKIPPRSSFIFPHTLAVEPMTLAKWLQKRENLPSILLLDVRPLSMYKEGCIKHTWICQIEPLSLRQE